MNITEDYCSYEVAKLLKEKGFDGLCYCHEFTDYEGNSTTYHTEYPENWNQSEPCVSIPTLGMAMKWLREFYSIFICIKPYDSYYDDKYEFSIYKKENTIIFKWELLEIENSLYEGYEETVEAALKYVLENLI